MVERGGSQNSDGIATEEGFHQVAFTLSTRKVWVPDSDVEVVMICYLPTAGVTSGMRIISSQIAGLKAEFPTLPEAVLGWRRESGYQLQQSERQSGGLQGLSERAAGGSCQWRRSHYP